MKLFRRKKRGPAAKIPNTTLTYSRPKPKWQNILARHAVYAYTNRWSAPIRAVMENKTIRDPVARLYAKQIMSRMKPKTYNGPLYRGLKGRFVSGPKKSFSSFTKNRNVANGYAYPNGNILVINAPKNIPSINMNNYKSSYQGDSEVLIAPGTFKVIKRNGRFVHLIYASSVH